MGTAIQPKIPESPGAKSNGTEISAENFAMLSIPRQAVFFFRKHLCSPVEQTGTE